MDTLRTNRGSTLIWTWPDHITTGKDNGYSWIRMGIQYLVYPPSTHRTQVT